MSYDVYSDEYNPVKKQPKFGLGDGNGGGNFEYGNGPTVDASPNAPADGVCEGYTSAQQAFTNWDRESGGSKATFSDYVEGPDGSK